MLEVVTVVVVSEEGNGGGCFVSSCGWFDMFFLIIEMRHGYFTEKELIKIKRKSHRTRSKQ